LSRPLVERRVGALTLDMPVVSAQKKGPGLLKHTQLKKGPDASTLSD
jgi:hypothetical protein